MLLVESRLTSLALAMGALLVMAAGQHGGASDPAKPPADAASAAFEKLKGLAGKWRGKSTKGWTDEATFKVVAGGSVVVGESFGAHPNETMYTMFHMDGKRLMLTHYCVAQNQPRLVATKFEDGGTKVTFEFQDATNLPSRDKGHMDKCVMKFLDAKRFTSQWTWFQDGKEAWMEEIVSERIEK